ncbi:MFS monosaccharide transporter-like protein [Pseudovirgaria hyperparasitica]|uniref:MFS monosaccharide transporter-like protein n=1 Tax=Pseudovirgaria hyperparasitica TaxID=470096 RepID=A0A6A6WB66_9PEZI|nr:MFS monosaccharide transporter-like protein [Pseudovirgaria hyperparasitica]KAF2759805.1 MFS monosaccharide transporter-like protein [Pseudovirgaria hyperparasitica]
MATTTSDVFHTRAPTILAVTTVFIVLSSVFVALRMISRIAIVHKVGLDDYLMLGAWLISFGMSFAICYGTSVGLGRHEEDIPPAWDSALKKSQYAFSVLYNPALMATKTSILAFYLTLSRTHQFFRWSTLTTLAIVNLAGVALTILNIVQCRPVEAAFDQFPASTAHCTDIVTLYLSSAPVNIITDLAILILPMPILTGMHLPRKQKTILIITFSFGVFVTAVDVVRIAYLQSAVSTRLRSIAAQQTATEHGDTRSFEANDFSWYAGFSFMWSAIEVHVGMMCACVPALKPLVARFLPKMLRDDTCNDRTGVRTSTGHMDGSLDARNMEGLPTATAPQRPQSAAADPQRVMSQEIDMMDFLTTPDMRELPERIARTQTAMTNTTRHTQPSSQKFFEFVNIRQGKSMVHFTHRESIFPLTMVTLLFFVWGFAYGLLDVLNSRFQEIAHMSSLQTVGIHSAYFAGYFIGPITFGRLVLKNWGFKACYIVGLIIYGCGTLIFWPSAVLTSFPAFLVSNFIVALGLSTLEIAANPFIALVGPSRYAETRLNLSQGIQAVGTVVSPLLAKKVLFKAEADSLIDVQWTYLGISLFTFLLALAYYYVPLPEATDDELDDASERYDAANTKTMFNVKTIWLTLAVGVFSLFCYVGGQEVVATSFGPLTSVLMPRDSESDTTNDQAIAHTVFAISRFVSAAATCHFKPRHVLLFFYAGAIAFSAAAMHGIGLTPTVLVMSIYFFEGPIFSIVFAMCLRGMGRHTKMASIVLTAAVSGGAVFPPIAYSVQKSHGTQYALCVAVAAFTAGTLLALWTELVPKARRIVDPLTDPSAANSDDDEEEEEEDSAERSGSESKRSSILRGIRRKIRELKDEMPTREHRERKSWPSSPQKDET